MIRALAKLPRLSQEDFLQRPLTFFILRRLYT